MRTNDTLLMTLLLSLAVVGCGDDNSHELPTTAEPTATTTTSIAPIVSATSPTDGETDVLINRKIVATFSDAMDPATITETSFTVMHETTLVLGAIVYSTIDRTATFTPTDNILPNTTYTATITNEAATATITIEPTDMGSNGQTVDPTKDINQVGNPLTADKVWTFTTGDL